MDTSQVLADSHNESLLKVLKNFKMTVTHWHVATAPTSFALPTTPLRAPGKRRGPGAGAAAAVNGTARRSRAARVPALSADPEVLALLLPILGCVICHVFTFAAWHMGAWTLMLLMSAFMAPTTPGKIDRDIRVREHVRACNCVGTYSNVLRIREMDLSTVLNGGHPLCDQFLLTDSAQEPGLYARC